MNPHKDTLFNTSRHSCPRCDGFIVPEQLWDNQGTCDPLWVSAIRCTNCGFIAASFTKPHMHKAAQRRPRRQQSLQVIPIRSGSVD